MWRHKLQEIMYKYHKQRGESRGSSQMSTEDQTAQNRANSTCPNQLALLTPSRDSSETGSGMQYMLLLTFNAPQYTYLSGQRTGKQKNYQSPKGSLEAKPIVEEPDDKVQTFNPIEKRGGPIITEIIDNEVDNQTAGRNDHLTDKAQLLHGAEDLAEDLAITRHRDPGKGPTEGLSTNASSNDLNNGLKITGTGLHVEDAKHSGNEPVGLGALQSAKQSNAQACDPKQQLGTAGLDIAMSGYRRRCNDFTAEDNRLSVNGLQGTARGLDNITSPNITHNQLKWHYPNIVDSNLKITESKSAKPTELQTSTYCQRQTEDCNESSAHDSTSQTLQGYTPCASSKLHSHSPTETQYNLEQTSSFKPIQGYNTEPADTIKDSLSISDTDRRGDPINWHSSTTNNNSDVITESGKRLEQLVSVDGLHVHDVVADGNCLFAAVVDQLRMYGNFFYTPQTLRQAAVDYLRTHPTQDDGTPLHLFLTEVDGSWDDYLQRMSRGGEWGDHMILNAISSILSRRIVILRGRSGLEKTVVSPSSQIESNKNKPEPKEGTPIKPVKAGNIITKTQNTSENSNNFQDTEQNPKLGSLRVGSVVKADKESMEDLYIGHIAEAHYVSLRRENWVDHLHQVLSESKKPCYLLGAEHKDDIDPNDDIPDRKNDLATPEVIISYIVGYLQRNLIKVKMSFNYNDESMFGTRSWKTDPSTDVSEKSISTIVATDSLIVDNRVYALKKDLLFSVTHSPIGYTRLSPVTPKLWKGFIVNKDGDMFLKHIPFRTPEDSRKCRIAFRMEWPSIASEWVSRERKSHWPSQKVVSKVVEEGVFVIPESEQEDAKGDELDWKISFETALPVLYKEMKAITKTCCFVMYELVKTVFNGRPFKNLDLILKAILLYTCEEIRQERFKNDPGYAVVLMIRRLIKGLQQAFIPSYFIHEQNMLSPMDATCSDWFVAQLQQLDAQFIGILFILSGVYSFTKEMSFPVVFDLLVSDLQCQHGNRNDQRKCNGEEFNSGKYFNVEIREYVKSMELCSASRVLQSLLDDDVFDIANMPKYVIEVLTGLPLMNQWIFSFYLELVYKQRLVQGVCSHRECIPLADLVGERCIELIAIDLEMHDVSSMEIPVKVLTEESKLTVVEQISSILYQKYLDDAYYECLMFFLLENSRTLMEQISNEEKIGGKHTGHVNTINSLSRLFWNLYLGLQSRNRVKDFFPLMELYEMLCDHLNSADAYNRLAGLWEYFGNENKAQEALTKWKAFTKCRSFLA